MKNFVGNSDDDYVAQSGSGIIHSGDFSVPNNSTEDLDTVAMIVF